MSFYSVGVSALNAAQMGLTTTGHNISNVNTEGYHRQVATQATNIPIGTGAGFIGQGTHTDTIKRVYSQFLDNQVLQAQTQNSHLDSYLTEIQQIDNLLADPNAGLSPALQEFFKAVGDVAANPQSVPSRQVLLNSANAMITRFQTLDQRFTEIREGVNTQITDSITSINSSAQQIAKLNEQIVLQSGNTGQAPNDLLDQRDTLVAQLNQQVRTTVVKQTDGTINVFIGNGQPLVVSQQAYKLVATPSPEDQQRVEVAFNMGAANIILPAGSLNGGTLGGLLEFRNQTLDAAQNALGRVAVSLAQTFNDQHALGQDLAGNLGGDFFAVPSPAVLNSTANAGDAVITASLLDPLTQTTSVKDLSTSDYRLTYDAATTDYKLLRISDSTQTTITSAEMAAGYTTADGFTLQLSSGSPAGSDSFLILPTRFAARDITLSSTINTTTIAAASPIVTSAVLANTGTGKISAGSIDTTPPLSPDPAHPSTDVNLQVPITITFTDAATFDVVDASTGFAIDSGVAYVPGGNISYNGWTVQITGAPATGDTFTIGSNINGVADNRNALALAQLQTRNTMMGGTASYQGAYSQLVSEVGSKTNEVKVTGKAQQNLLTQAKSAAQELSGVNLDEEAANLLRYQQAYQAAGKMMQIATNMFDVLLQIGK